MVFVPILTVRNVNKDERNEKCSQIFAHLGGGMDCVTASYAGVAGSSPTQRSRNLCLFHSFIIPPYHYLFSSYSSYFLYNSSIFLHTSSYFLLIPGTLLIPRFFLGLGKIPIMCSRTWKKIRAISSMDMKHVSIAGT